MTFEQLVFWALVYLVALLIIIYCNDVILKNPFNSWFLKYLSTGSLQVNHEIKASTIEEYFLRKYGKHNILYDDGTSISCDRYIGQIIHEAIKDNKNIKYISDSDVGAFVNGTGELNKFIDPQNFIKGINSTGYIDPQITEIEIYKDRFTGYQCVMIGKVNIYNSNYTSFHNCWIKQVNIPDNASVGKLHFGACQIGYINIGKNSVDSLTFSNCVIDSIKLNPQMILPVKNIVSIDDKTKIGYGHGNSDVKKQDLRNLRILFKKLSNIKGEYLVHAEELRQERKGEGLVMKMISCIYDITAGYGNNPERVLVTMIISLLFIFGFSYVYNPSSILVNCDEINYSSTWIKHDLCSGNRFVEAIISSFQPILNPFSIFKKSLIAYKTFGFTVLYSLFGLWMILQISILFIAVRRKLRYK